MKFIPRIRLLALGVILIAVLVFVFYPIHPSVNGVKSAYSCFEKIKLMDADVHYTPYANTCEFHLSKMAYSQQVIDVFVTSDYFKNFDSVTLHFDNEGFLISLSEAK